MKPRARTTLHFNPGKQTSLLFSRSWYAQGLASKKTVGSQTRPNMSTVIYSKTRLPLQHKKTSKRLILTPNINQAPRPKGRNSSSLLYALNKEPHEEAEASQQIALIANNNLLAFLLLGFAYYASKSATSAHKLDLNEEKKYLLALKTLPKVSEIADEIQGLIEVLSSEQDAYSKGLSCINVAGTLMALREIGSAKHYLHLATVFLTELEQTGTKDEILALACDIAYLYLMLNKQHEAQMYAELGLKYFSPNSLRANISMDEKASLLHYKHICLIILDRYLEALDCIQEVIDLGSGKTFNYYMIINKFFENLLANFDNCSQHLQNDLNHFLLYATVLDNEKLVKEYDMHVYNHIILLRRICGLIEQLSQVISPEAREQGSRDNSNYQQMLMKLEEIPKQINIYVKIIKSYRSKIPGEIDDYFIIGDALLTLGSEATNLNAGYVSSGLAYYSHALEINENDTAAKILYMQRLPKILELYCSELYSIKLVRDILIYFEKMPQLSAKEVSAVTGPTAVTEADLALYIDCFYLVTQFMKLGIQSTLGMEDAINEESFRKIQSSLEQIEQQITDEYFFKRQAHAFIDLARQFANGFFNLNKSTNKEDIGLSLLKAVLAFLDTLNDTMIKHLFNNSINQEDLSQVMKMLDYLKGFLADMEEALITPEAILKPSPKDESILEMLEQFTSKYNFPDGAPALAYLIQSFFLFRNAKFEQAIHKADLIISSRRESGAKPVILSLAYRVKLYALLKLNRDLTSILGCLDEAISAVPTNESFYFYFLRGHYYLSVKKIDEGRSDLEKWEAQNPWFGRIHQACLNRFKTTSLHCELLVNSTDLSRFISSEHVNAYNPDMNTPLHLAIEKENVSAIKQLLTNGANLHQARIEPLKEDGLLVFTSPIDLAKQAKNKNILPLLLQNGTNISPKILDEIIECCLAFFKTNLESTKSQETVIKYFFSRLIATDIRTEITKKDFIKYWGHVNGFSGSAEGVALEGWSLDRLLLLRMLTYFWTIIELETNQQSPDHFPKKSGKSEEKYTRQELVELLKAELFYSLNLYHNIELSKIVREKKVSDESAYGVLKEAYLDNLTKRILDLKVGETLSVDTGYDGHCVIANFIKLETSIRVELHQAGPGSNRHPTHLKKDAVYPCLLSKPFLLHEKEILKAYLTTLYECKKTKPHESYSWFTFKYYFAPSRETLIEKIYPMVCDEEVKMKYSPTKKQDRANCVEVSADIGRAIRLGHALSDYLHETETKVIGRLFRRDENNMQAAIEEQLREPFFERIYNIHEQAKEQDLTNQQQDTSSAYKP